MTSSGMAQNIFKYKNNGKNVKKENEKAFD